MLIMIVYYYVYKRVQQFLTHLTGLRKGLVTVNVDFYALYLCVCVHVCMFIVLFALFLYVLLIAWNLFYGVHCFHVFSHIYIYIYIHHHHHCYELYKTLRALGIEHCIRCSLLLLLLLLIFILLFVFDVNLWFRDGTLSRQFCRCIVRLCVAFILLHPS